MDRVESMLIPNRLVDALCSDIAADGRLTTAALLHAASGEGQLEMVRELNPFLSTEN